MKSPHVLFVLPWSLDPSAGGVQRSTVQLAAFLNSRGWTVSVLTTEARPPSVQLPFAVYHPSVISSDPIGKFVGETIGQLNVDVVVNQAALLPELSDAVAGAQRERKAPFKLISCFRNNPAQFRDNHRAMLRHLWRRHPWRLRAIDHEWGWEALLAWHRRRNAGRFRQALARCDRFMLLSPTFVNELRWYVPDLDERKVITIPNGFDTSIPSTGTPSRQKENRILFVGRMEQQQKNVLLIPELWSLLQARVPHWELDLVGEGPELALLEQRMAEAGLGGWTAHGKQVPHEYFARSKLFLMLSAYEGFGNTLIEAQMHGTVPVAFHSYSAIDWIVNDGQDAVLVPPFDLERYADEVVRLATDAARWRHMSRQARANAERFSGETIGHEWEKVFEELLEERISTPAQL